MFATPFNDRDGYIWIDGQIKPWRDATDHVLSQGLHYGGSVFEGIRSYEGNIFRLHEHTMRLKKSAELLNFKISQSVEEIKDVCKEMLFLNGITDGYIRPIAWRGSERMDLSMEGCTVHCAVACWEWPPYFDTQSGIKLFVSRWRRPGEDFIPLQSKTAASYCMGTLAKTEADNAGYDDAVMLDPDGYVAESSASNIFIVVNGVLKTPKSESCLNGITRQTILQLAKDMGLKAEEDNITPEDLLSADEVFVTGTAAEVTAVIQVDNKKYKYGQITKQLQQAYVALTSDALVLNQAA